MMSRFLSFSFFHTMCLFLVIAGGAVISVPPSVQAMTGEQALTEQVVSKITAGLYTDPYTLQTPDVRVYDLVPFSAVYADSDGRQSVLSVLERYERGDRPRFGQFSLLTNVQRGQTIWVVVPLYNRTKQEEWALDFGTKLTGGRGAFSSLMVVDAITGQSWTYGAEQAHFIKSRQVPVILRQSDTPPFHFLVMKIIPRQGEMVSFPLRLVPGGDAATPLYPWQQPVLFKAVGFLFFGFTLCLAFLTGRRSIVIPGLYILSLVATVTLEAELVQEYTTLSLYADEALLIIQNLFLCLTLWIFASLSGLKSERMPLLLLVLVGHVLAFCIIIILPLSFSGGVIGHLLLSGVSFVIAALIMAVQTGQNDRVSMYQLGTIGVHFISILVSEMGGAHLLAPISFVVTAPVYGALILSILLLAHFRNVNVFFEAEDTARSGRRDPRLAEQMAKLRHVKDNLDYNNLLKVIEHERRQLTEARTRESVRTEEMRKAKEGADEANRAKSAFLAVISHEIRTPMTGIMGMVKLMMDTTLTKTQHDYVMTIKESGNAMMALLNDILDFEKIESGKLQLEYIDFDLHRLISGVVTLMNGHASTKNVYLNVEMDPSTPRYVVGDMVRLRQVLLNLVGNAIKFTSRGGVTIRVNATSNQQDDGPANFYQIYFSVQDTGIGISPEAQRNIFTPFAQADKSITRKFGGSGLGLAISRRLIEAMGSQINIKSQEGKGTIFFFTLGMSVGNPAMVEDQGAATGSLFAPPVIQQKEAKKEALRILVVEDNEITQRVLTAMLEKEGHQAMAIASAEDALSFIDMGELFDLIFTDVSMPGMSGFDFVRAIRASNSDRIRALPVVALTGHTDQKDIDEGMAAGMSAFLIKPIEPEKMQEVLERFAPPSALATSGNGSVGGGALVDGGESHPPLFAPAGAPLAQNLPEELEMINALRESLGSNQLRELLKGLYEKTEEIIGVLESKPPLGVEETRDRAHELKGMCANFGLVTLASFAREIEEKAAAGTLEDVPALIEQLMPTYKMGRKLIEDWLESQLS